MINANELRIGNWVYDTRSAGDSASVKNSMRVNIIQDKDYKYFSPIPLTPEILEKCGFKLIDDKISPFYKLILDRTSVISIEDDFSFGLNAEDEDSTMGFASTPNLVKYLHQLQNLYFALTGEELIYKP